MIMSRQCDVYMHDVIILVRCVFYVPRSETQPHINWESKQKFSNASVFGEPMKQGGDEYY